MSNSGLLGARIFRSTIFSFFTTVLVLLAAHSPAEAGYKAEPFKTYDMMGLDWVPEQHRGKNLEKIAVFYEDSMFCGNVPLSVCYSIDRSEPIANIIRWRAYQARSEDVVAINIESSAWDLLSDDQVVVDNAVANWQTLLNIWREVNTRSTILIYGVVPRVYSDQLFNDQAKIDLKRDLTKRKASLFKNERVYAWPSAYIHTDSPDLYRLERQWQIDICHEVLKTKCYFAITPVYLSYTDNETGGRLPLDQRSFLEIMTTLKIDGAEGIGLWLAPTDAPESYDGEYIERMQAWSWNGGSQSIYRDKNLQWMAALEKFLDLNMETYGRRAKGKLKQYCSVDDYL